MSEFEALLNAEIVEAGRVPNKEVVLKTKEMGEILETHYTDGLEIFVSSSEDEITVSADITDYSGFKLVTRIKKEDQSVENELIVWHTTSNTFINIKGTLAVKDFEYALNREKEFTYLDEPI